MANPEICRVYRNLNKNTWSIQRKTKNGWRVFYWSDEIILKNSKFKVSKSGRARVLREKRKNVHAYVIGELIFVHGLTLNTLIKNTNQIFQTQISYNPYKYETFVNKNTEKEIHDAELVFLKSSGQVWI
jgi:hypothetical protein